MAAITRSISLDARLYEVASSAAFAEASSFSGYVSGALIQRLREEGRWDEGPAEHAGVIDRARRAGIDVADTLRREMGEVE